MEVAYMEDSGSSTGSGTYANHSYYFTSQRSTEVVNRQHGFSSTKATVKLGHSTKESESERQCKLSNDLGVLARTVCDRIIIIFGIKGSSEED